MAWILLKASRPTYQPGQTEKKAMSNSVTSKFAGLFRSLLRRGEESSEVASEAARPVAAGLPLPGTEMPPAVAPAPVSVPASANSDDVVLPLAPIVAGLPMDLRAKMMSVPPPGATIILSLETVVSQLAFGSVKISFGELRQLAPGLFANSGGEQDFKMISLPLNEILPRLSPTLLSRRSIHKVEVDDEIKGPFASQGRGVVFTTQPMKAERPATKGKTDFFPQRTNTPVSTLPATPPIAFNLPSTPVRPAASNGAGNQPSVLPITPIASTAPAAPVTPPTPPSAPAPKITFSAAPAPVPPAAASSVPRSEPAQPTIFASLWDLAESWPEELKNEILATALANCQVPLNGTFVAEGLKRGRITMKWRQIRILAMPSSNSSMNDSLELELPLKVIAPLFFAAQKNLAKPKTKPAVSEEIPNLFFGFPQAAPAALAPQPPKKQAESNSNFYVWGDNGEVPVAEEAVFTPPPVPQTDFTSRQAAPKDVVARALALPGVAGAVVALPDGLRVASEVPAGLNPDTLAAFVPQIFERMNQSAKELRMGVLSNVSFTVGNVPWRIYRVNAVYVAAFGRAGEALPAAQLAALAGELDRKKQH